MNPDLLTPAQRVCTKCLLPNPLTAEYFKPSTRQTGGFRTWCKECDRTYQREYARAHRDKRNAASRARYHADPEQSRLRQAQWRVRYADAIKAGQRRWRETHKDYRREYERQHRKAHPERYREKSRAYRRTHREQLRAYDRQRYHAQRDRINAQRKQRYALAKAIRQQQQAPIAEAAIAGLRPLVLRLAAQLRQQRHLPASVHEDMVAEGMLGLVKGIRRYDPRKGAKLSTFVFYTIRGAMLEFLRRDDHIPRGVRERARREGRELPGAPLSLFTPIGYSKDGGTERTLLETLPDTQSVPLEQHGWEVLRGRQQSAALQQALQQLSLRERQVLASYYGQERTLEEVSVILGISESRAYQLREQALAKLRLRLEREQL